MTNDEISCHYSLPWSPCVLLLWGKIGKRSLPKVFHFKVNRLSHKAFLKNLDIFNISCHYI